MNLLNISTILYHFLLYYQVALHMRAYQTFKDVKGVTHKNGEEWLIKMAGTEAHIPHVYEEVHTYCIVYYYLCCLKLCHY